MSRYALPVLLLPLVLSCANAPYDPPASAKLPDPFLLDGGSRMTQRSEWATRRAQIAAQAKATEFGDDPGAPAVVTGSFVGSALTVTCGDGGASIEFSCPVVYPSGSGPFPAMIVLGGSSMSSLFLSLGVAVIMYNNDDIAAQVNASSRGKGKFYDLYGSGYDTGALMAWAWGASRIIDALSQPAVSAASRIDPARIGVTGCSRNGKGALVCGAFDDRIVLTMPQESGSGGAASWRVSRLQQILGQNVQTLSEIVGENCWFRSGFSSYAYKEDQLPFDHHMVEALCAPRALLVIENSSMEWLGNWSTWTTANLARRVWDALEVPGNMGYSQVGHSDHCGFVQSQQGVVSDYVRKFLLSASLAANSMQTDAVYRSESAAFANWSTPALR